jgi:uncharacterized protein involved in exopolysaccharide biosynthesis
MPMNENEKRPRPAEGPAGGPAESYYYEDEIDLAELVGVLWRRRWFMLVVIIFFVGLAVTYCFITTQRYEIVAQIRPGVTGFNEKENPIRDWAPNDIEAWFSSGVYLDTVAGLLGDNASIPKINAGSGRQANLVTVSLYWPDSEQGKQILGSVIDALASTGSKGVKRQLAVSRRQIEAAIHETESELEHIPIERGRFDDQIAREKNKIQVINTKLEAIKRDKTQTEGVIGRLRGQIDSINQNTAELMKLRQQMVAGESDKFALLMYSNIIQQNITYITGLEQRIAVLEKELNGYRVKETEKSDEIRSTQIEIKDLQVKREQELSMKEANLQKKMQTLDAKLEALLPVEVVKSPFSSLRTVKPAKAKIVAIAFVLGCFMAVVMAFLREFWIKNRERISPGSKGS